MIPLFLTGGDSPGWFHNGSMGSDYRKTDWINFGMRNSRRDFIRQISLAALAAPVALHTLRAGPATAALSPDEQG
ncbi:MAG: twin-arginine translocation signal domain-containing protein, partial [Verrucomicrobiota bacterium]